MFRERSGTLAWQSVSGNNSVVECDLAKVEVAGSNPVSRSKIYRRGPLHPAWRPSLRRRFDAGSAPAARPQGPRLRVAQGSQVEVDSINDHDRPNDTLLSLLLIAAGSFPV